MKHADAPYYMDDQDEDSPCSQCGEYECICPEPCPECGQLYPCRCRDSYSSDPYDPYEYDYAEEVVE